jgi:hypothetical protein
VRKITLPSFVDAIFAEAEAYGQKSLKALKAQQTRRAKAFFDAATMYHQRAEAACRDASALESKIVEMAGK